MSRTDSKWKENAEWRRENHQWLRYSQSIALKVLRVMDEKGLTQSRLAEMMGCSQQYVSAILKGSSNMTLETISRLEETLDIDLIKGILGGSRGYIIREEPLHEVCEEACAYGSKSEPADGGEGEDAGRGAEVGGVEEGVAAKL